MLLFWAEGRSTIWELVFRLLKEQCKVGMQICENMQRIGAQKGGVRVCHQPSLDHILEEWSQLPQCDDTTLLGRKVREDAEKRERAFFEQLREEGAAFFEQLRHKQRNSHSSF